MLCMKSLKVSPLNTDHNRIKFSILSNKFNHFIYNPSILYKLDQVEHSSNAIVDAKCIKSFEKEILKLQNRFHHAIQF